MTRSAEAVWTAVKQLGAVDAFLHFAAKCGKVIRTANIKPHDAPALSLCGLDPESLRDRCELVADLLNAGGELVRATQIDDLAGHS
jgi:hypothetical protein